MLCLEIAGLCHDLGHGPFSHLFDAKILPKIVADKSNYHFEHEHASIAILDLLIKDNDLLPEFKKHGLSDEDIHFIKVSAKLTLNNLIINNIHLCILGADYWFAR